MPDNKTVDNIPNGDAHKSDGSPSADAGSVDVSVFDNMSVEELKEQLAEKSKSFNALHTKMGEMSGELGQLRSFRKEIEGESRLAEAVSAVKSLVEEKNKEPELDYEAFEAEIMAKAEENPSEAFKDLLRTTNSWQLESENKLKSQHEKEMAEVREQLSALAEAYQTTTDDYKENKELIETLRKDGGMTLAKATQLAKEIRSKMPESQNATPPASVNPTRTVIQDKSNAQPWTNEDVQRWQAEGRSEQFIEMMKWKRERDAGLSDKDKEQF